MARGITESDVHDAADELVAAGERPTVERIRAHLGTGSPNTVTRWLETWWQGLGLRLNTQRAHLAIPNAPEAITALAGEWWARALTAAQEHARQGLAADHVALEADRVALAQARATSEVEAASLRQTAVEASQAERLAQAQALELQRQIEALGTQITDLGNQRDAAQVRGDRIEAEFLALTRRLEEQKEASAKDRETQAQRVLAMENRAHLEVDRARQEVKEARAQMTTALAARDAKETVLQRQRDEALAANAVVQREMAALQARSQTMEEQLTQLRESIAPRRQKARTAKPGKQRVGK